MLVLNGLPFFGYCVDEVFKLTEVLALSSSVISDNDQCDPSCQFVGFALVFPFSFVAQCVLRPGLLVFIASRKLKHLLRTKYIALCHCELSSMRSFLSIYKLCTGLGSSFFAQYVLLHTRVVSHCVLSSGVWMSLYFYVTLDIKQAKTVRSG